MACDGGGGGGGAAIMAQPPTFRFDSGGTLKQLEASGQPVAIWVILLTPRQPDQRTLVSSGSTSKSISLSRNAGS